MKLYYKIEKGDRFLCKKDYIMDDGNELAYKQGVIYTSHHDYCITDEDGDSCHGMSDENDFFEYFELVK